MPTFPSTEPQVPLSIRRCCGRLTAPGESPPPPPLPGQCRALQAPKQGEGWVFLAWEKPADGGAPAAYRVQRREPPSQAWSDVAMTIASEIALTDQTRAKELEYRVIAFNKAGQGQPSNAVMVVL